MIRETLPVGQLRCNCTIVGDERSLEAFVVDPGDDIARIMAVVSKHGLTVKQIIVTHGHIDHIAGAQQLKALTGAPIFYNQRDLPLVALMDVQARWLGLASAPEVLPPDGELTDGHAVGVEGLAGTVIETPGHTPGSLCVYLPAESLLIAGDTLFAGSIGRTDLPFGDSRMIIRSIKDRLMALPDETLVVPGHGVETKIGAERDGNPFLQ